MSFVNVSVLEDHLTQVLDCLAKLGVMHVVDKEELPPSVEGLEDIEVDPIRDEFDALDSRIEGILTTLSIASFPSISGSVGEEKIEIDPFQISEKVRSDLSEIEGEVNPVIQRRIRIQEEISELEEDSRQLSALEIHGVSIEALKESQFLYIAFGDIPEEYYERLVGSLANVPCVLVPGPIMGARQQILAFSLMSDRDALSGALDAAYFSKARIPDKYHGDIVDVLDEIELDIWTRREEMAEIQAQIRALRQRWRDKLLELHATILANQIVLESVEKFGKIETSYFLSGWVPYSDVRKLQRSLRDISEEGILINASEPITAEEAEHYGSKVPTKLKHPFFLRPFTGLVTNFGIPGYSDIDPTPFASLAFLAMFGIMFADVGHGGVLLILGLLGALYPHPQLKSARSMSAFLACCGGASMIFGFVFGSVFGKEEIIRPLWFSLEHMNPESVNRMLKLGVFFGIGMLSLGVFLNIAQSFRRKNFKEAFCGQWGLFKLSATT